VSGESSALVELGVLGAPHGIRGWLRCRSFTDPPERILAYRRWQVGIRGEWREYEVAESSSRGGRMTVKLLGIDSPESAAMLRGGAVAVSRSELPALAEKEFYRADLVGFEVTDLAGRLLGTLTHFVETPAHALMAVRGEVERLIPALPKHLRRVDLGGRRIEVDWREDWLDD
jgi:16S rRNA processing protein RimM